MRIRLVNSYPLSRKAEVMNKQEVIRKAWGVYWNELKEFIDENGWLPWCYRGTSIDKNPASLADMYMYCGGQGNHEKKHLTQPDNKTLFRPKSLQGIENNNGWIKIESEADLPNEYGYYFAFDNLSNDVNIILFSPENKVNWIDNVTHYQPITKPLKPIY